MPNPTQRTRKMTFAEQRAAMTPMPGPFAPLREADDITSVDSELARLRAWRDELLALVASQAEDETLWAQAEYISEAYIQQELRRLTALVEREP